MGTASSKEGGSTQRPWKETAAGGSPSVGPRIPSQKASATLICGRSYASVS